MTKRPRAIGKRSSKGSKIAAAKYYRVLVEMSPHESVRNLSGFRLDHSCMPQPLPTASGARHLHAFAGGAAIVALRKAGRKVKVLADTDAEGVRLRKHVGRGDRFLGGRSGPKGVGRLI